MSSVKIEIEEPLAAILHQTNQLAGLPRDKPFQFGWQVADGWSPVPRDEFLLVALAAKDAQIRYLMGVLALSDHLTKPGGLMRRNEIDSRPPCHHLKREE